MTGYMAASQAASVHAFGQWMDACTSTARVLSGGPLPAMQPAAPAQAMVAGFNPMDFWLAFTPFGRSPVVLQMAYAMMSFGVPRAVAIPTAEANSAALDALSLATSGASDDVFSVYRSGGGHATAQIVRLHRAFVGAALSPAALGAVWGWTSTPVAPTLY
jgi:hypothetical protein